MRRRPGKELLSPERAADSGSAHAAAISMLVRRDFSTEEITRRLTDRGYTREAVDRALARLRQSNTLNDARYGQNIVAYRARRGQGPARIRNELRMAGVAPELIDSAIKSDDDAPDFLKLARQARERKFGPDIPRDWKERARQARFLQYRGFSTDHIRAVLEGDPEVDSGPDAGSEPNQS